MLMNHLRVKCAVLVAGVLSVCACGGTDSGAGTAGAGGKATGATGGSGSTGGSGATAASCAALVACLCDDDPTDPVCTTLKAIVTSTTQQNGPGTAEAYCASLPMIQPALYGSCDLNAGHALSSGGAAGGSGPNAGAGAAPVIEAQATAVGSVAGVTPETIGASSVTTIMARNAEGAVLIANTGNLCAFAFSSTKGNTDLANGQAIQLVFQNLGSTQFAIGSYPLRENATSGRAAQARVSFNDAACNAVTHDALSGVVELTRIDDAGVTGTYSLKFDGDDQLSGSFKAPLCNELLTTKLDPSAPASEVCLPLP